MESETGPRLKHMVSSVYSLTFEKEIDVKVRSGLLMLAALLVLGVFAFTPAAFAAPPNATSAVESSASPAAGCATATQTIDFLKLTPGSPVAMAATCGVCSLDSCAGATIGQICHYGRFGSQTGSCQSVYGDRCSGTNTLACQCWSGPLP